MSTPAYVVDFTTANDTPMRMLVLAPGEYVNPHRCADTQWCVEFFDRRYVHTDWGQFTGGRYYASTLLESFNRGLCVDGGVPEWDIDAETLTPLLALLRAVSS